MEKREAAGGSATIAAVSGIKRRGGEEEPGSEVEALEKPRLREIPTSAESDPLDAPELYLNRELTWLEFNRRVLHEARDARNPLLERLKFEAIVGSNLDEFFMKRIGGLKQQVGAGMLQPTVDGRTPQQQIDESYAVVRQFETERRTLLTELLAELEHHGISLTTYDRLTAEEQQALRDTYCKNIFPLVTPQAMDPAHPFPFISNLSLNLLVTLHYPGDTQQSMARVKVPVGAGTQRLLQVGADRRFVRLEDVMAHNLDLLFPSMEIDACELFRVTRNANTESDEEEADDLLAMIESELRERRLAPIVRLEVQKGMDPVHRGMLAAEFGLNEQTEIFDVEGIMAIRDLMELATIEVPTLRDPPHRPVDHFLLQRTRNVFHILRDAGSILVQHPYESYTTSVERFLREASEDPKVRAIKMTLYRTSRDSMILDYLYEAARNGKQVAVVVELKARFDEAANIRFANRLEEFGIHVTYGVVGLKTHCKVILVVRQDYTGLRRYAHIGTGNYHAGTARIYSDFGLLTCDDAIGQDLTELFNYLTTGYRPKRNYKKLLPAPTLLKKALLTRIEREIAKHTSESPGLIQFKMNALEDVDVTRALYRASRAGVKVDLIVRDTCRLRPGLPGISDNIRVVSVVGRFLEHGRVYYFRNGGEEEYFIGSADCMKRNLESRIEVVAPVEDPALRKQLRAVLDIQLGPDTDVWQLRSDGSYERPTPPERQRRCHQLLIDLAEKRQKEAGRLRRRRPKGFARRAGE
jgi:polyphosphate kinase